MEEILNNEERQALLDATPYYERIGPTDLRDLVGRTERKIVAKLARLAKLPNISSAQVGLVLAKLETINAQPTAALAEAKAILKGILGAT